jgi:hypothetical protein
VAQPGHWFRPVTGLGWLGLAQPMWAELDPAPKIIKNKKIEKIKNRRNRKIKKICVCMDKNNINLLVYSPTPESGVKYWFKFILFLFVIFYFI